MDDFMKVQKACNEKMANVNKNYKASEPVDGDKLIDAIREEMNRLNGLKDLEWTRGDHFHFEDKDHTWLIDNLTSSVPGYHGC